MTNKRPTFSMLIQASSGVKRSISMLGIGSPTISYRCWKAGFSA